MDSLNLEKLRSLIEKTVRINADYSDIDALPVQILESAMRFIACESSFLLLLNKNDGLLHVVASLGSEPADLTNIPADIKSIGEWVFSHNQPVLINEIEKDSRFSGESRLYARCGIVSVLAVPLCINAECAGVIGLVNSLNDGRFSKTDSEFLMLLSSLTGACYQNATLYRNAMHRITALQRSFSAGAGFHTFVYESRALKDLMHVVEKVAETNSSVLITGESGSGKELIAEQLHLKSSRKVKPFIRFNCASAEESFLERELFGSAESSEEENASGVKGCFELADGGTLFFDEIGALPLDIQAKLLQCIQTKVCKRLGSVDGINVDVRIVASTSCDLEAMVENGSFRSDLYYRLNVLPVHVPPLRDRKDDIIPLAEFFLNKSGSALKKRFTSFSDLAKRFLVDYYWPGNVRELENMIEYACIQGLPPVVQVKELQRSGYGEIDQMADDLSSPSDGDKSLKTAIDRFKKAYIMKILDETSWNQTAAGKVLGIQRTYVSRLLNELHIRDVR